MTDSYHIKTGYRVNHSTHTYDGESSESYWTENRLRLSLTYQRPIYEYAERVARTIAAPSIVDVGCGPALKLRRFVAPHAGRLVLVDQPSIEALARRNCPGADFIPLNLEAPESQAVPSAAFDLAICADVIEHLHDPDPCLELIARMLKPAGRLIISTPERDALRGIAAMACDKEAHVREWNFDEFASYLQSRGWKIATHWREYAVGVSSLRRWADRFLRREDELKCQAAVCHPPSRSRA
jgi:SAM-dependent methyltransferase